MVASTDEQLQNAEEFVSQSPSLRGSGRFKSRIFPVQSQFWCLNPLHCGAVVASNIAQHVDEKTLVFQSPSLRGSGRFGALRRALPSLEPEVSIPFIAGQWSLRGGGGSAGDGGAGFNPLHCGAVVASLDGGRGSRTRLHVSIPFIAGQWSLRGLITEYHSSEINVSIPFIAGQWSLRGPGLPGS